jgi:lysophospholipase L1-like esterase
VRVSTLVYRIFSSVVVTLLLGIGVGAAAQQRPVTVFLAGDSTMAKKLPEKRPETGWGEMLPNFFRKGPIVFDNRAQNGRSTRTFISEGRWQAIVAALQPGDYVFIQFGHNDESKEKTDRYTPPAEYRNNLIKFVAEARAKRAIAILLTPVMRRKFDKDGKLQDTHGEYPDIVRRVATEYKVVLIDMHRSSAQVLAEYGREGSRKLFLQLKPNENPNYPNGIEDNTHFNPIGAEVMARLAIDAIRQQRLELARFINPQPDAEKTAR